MIKLYLGNMIHDLRTSGEKKFCLTIKFNFVSSKDNNEKQLIHSKSDNMKIVICSITDEIINELFSYSFLRGYQIRLEESMKRSGFALDFVNGLHYKCNKIILDRSASYIDSFN